MRCRIYECAISYVPRTAEEGKKINWKDGVRALYCILHYSAPSAPLPMQLLLYSIIGAICAVANVVSFSILFHSGRSISIATLTAFLISAALNYFLCITILFRHRARWNTFGEIIAYLITIILMGLADYGMTVGLAGAGVSPTSSKIIATAAGFIGNFLLRRFLVFPQSGVVRV
jgi:putative flippase GtrA